MQALQSLLAADVVLQADGGGKKPAAMRPISGIESVVNLQERFFLHSFKDYPSQLLRYGLINGLPGFVSVERDDTVQTTALHIEAGKIVGIYVVRNPDKLKHLETVSSSHRAH
jgi:RNA polymerase sigma-70 factor (ECF subfamily)